MSATQERRDAEILRIGRQMSNVFFNLAQRGDGVSNIHLAANEYATFEQLYKEWDAATKKYRASFQAETPMSSDSSHYLQEVKDDLDGPSCHICGAIMVPVMPCLCDQEGLCGFSHEGFWRCKSCGNDTRPS